MTIFTLFRVRFFFFFFNDTATTEIYTLSLHDALPILMKIALLITGALLATPVSAQVYKCVEDRKSTRLNSSHLVISYAVFCLKKKNLTAIEQQARFDVAAFFGDLQKPQ